MNAAARRPSREPPAARRSSDLSVTEFLTLSRVGFLPHGLVVGVGHLRRGRGRALTGRRGGALAQPRDARRARLAVKRMRDQAAKHQRRGRRRRAAASSSTTGGAAGTRSRSSSRSARRSRSTTSTPRPSCAAAPTLRMADGRPFTSELSGQDFVTLLRAGYRPVSICVGSCVYELNGYGVWPYCAGRPATTRSPSTRRRSSTRARSRWSG